MIPTTGIDTFRICGAFFRGTKSIPKRRELFQAARKSLEIRGNGGTGWARAWKISLWARLRDGEQAHEVLRGLLKLSDSRLTEYKGGGVYPNLFDVHPPFSDRWKFWSDPWHR